MREFSRLIHGKKSRTVEADWLTDWDSHDITRWFHFDSLTLYHRKTWKGLKREKWGDETTPPVFWVIWSNLSKNRYHFRVTYTNLSGYCTRRMPSPSYFCGVVSRSHRKKQKEMTNTNDYNGRQRIKPRALIDHWPFLPFLPLFLKTMAIMRFVEK